MKRTIYFLSDGTGITVETLGHSLLTQFNHIEFNCLTLAYIDNEARAIAAAEQINSHYHNEGLRPIVFTTFADPQIRQIINNCDALVLDFFGNYISQLEAELDISATQNIGFTHSLKNTESYSTRIDAINFALSHDDGSTTREYSKAELILIGVSRCGKTPTCLYLALQFGIFVANYPFTEEDMDSLKLPPWLVENRSKLFGLTIDPQRLQSIRHERRPNSQYSSFSQCQLEIQKVETLFKQEQIPYLMTTTRSIEEISTTILAMKGIKRRLL